MNIVVPVKIVVDDQDIAVGADGSLDESKARPTVSTYDLNAIEIAAQLAEAQGDSTVTVVSAGPARIDDSKLKKSILARGVDKLLLVADDACADLDARQTAAVLSVAIAGVGDYDLVVCGDGSADNYAQQVDVQLAAALGLPVVTAVSDIEVQGDAIQCDRVLETSLQTVKVGLPAVVSVVPDVAMPRIAGMKDILAAGKKPSETVPASEVPSATVETVEIKAPKQVDRRQAILDATVDGDIAAFARALRAAV